MTLEELVHNINEQDENLIIFQKEVLSIDSEVVLFERDDDDSTTRTNDGIKYVYFLEMFLAQEFVSDWIESQKIKPDTREIAQRLLQYATYDA